MKKFPKKLKIGGHIYTIKIVNTTQIDGEKNDCMGFCDKIKCEIRLSNDLNETQLEETLLHEILHAINNVMSHELTESLGHSLHQVIKDNKLF